MIRFTLRQLQPHRLFMACVVIATLAMAINPVTIHLAGDSTMAEKRPERRPESGWGEFLQQHFPVAKVKVENYARGGRSTRTFIAEGLWRQLLERVKPGDFVFIQFGHNDEVPSKTDRYTTPDQYRSNLVRFVADVRARQATAVLLTPVSRRKFDKAGRIVDSHREYSDIVRAVAAEQQVPLIDMDKKSAAVLNRRGIENSKRLFLHLRAAEHPNFPDGIEDNTHFSTAGAALMAELAVAGVRELKLSIAQHLQPVAIGNQSKSGDLLSSARLARLSRMDRIAWQRYIERSDSVRTVDRAALHAAQKAAGVHALAAAPTGSGFYVGKSMTAEWFSSSEAAHIADILASYQAPNGGWSKRIEFARARPSGGAFTSDGNALWLSTLDNGATTEQLKFLGAYINASESSRHRAAFQRGVEYLLTSQFPNGCWPQIYPLAGSYHDAITFNDDATVNAVQLLNDVARKKYRFVADSVVTRARHAVERAVDCMVVTQVTQAGKKTVWGAQHDPLTYEPVRARAYEHASLSGRESATVLTFLMSLERPAPAAVRAVHAGAAWFKANAIHGFTYAFKSDLTPKEGAGPLWARFYELGTNRPIFSDRDGVVRYNLNEIGTERRYNYMWYTDEPAAMLRRYERWARTHPNTASNQK